MLHTLGVVEYRGEGLDIFILMNRSDVGCVQDLLCRVIGSWSI